jgi:hypothetical protein
MKECMKCGKKLGIIEGYRHPTMGKDYLLCNSCFDTVSVSVEKWSEVVSQYVGFFNKESSAIDDIQNIGLNIKKNVKKVLNLRFHKSTQKSNETLSTIY